MPGKQLRLVVCAFILFLRVERHERYRIELPAEGREKFRHRYSHEPGVIRLFCVFQSPHEFVYAFTLVRERRSGGVESVVAAVQTFVAIFPAAFCKRRAAALTTMAYKRNEAVGTKTVPTALVKFVIACGACYTLGIADPGKCLFDEGMFIHITRKRGAVFRAR